MMVCSVELDGEDLLDEVLLWTVLLDAVELLADDHDDEDDDLKNVERLDDERLEALDRLDADDRDRLLAEERDRLLALDTLLELELIAPPRGIQVLLEQV